MTCVEIVSTTRVTVHSEKKKELFLSISALLDRIRNEKGCCAYRFYREDKDSDSFLLIGEWESVTDWERHVRSENFEVLLGSLEVLGNDESIDFKVWSPIGEVEALMGKELETKGGHVSTYDSNKITFFPHA